MINPETQTDSRHYMARSAAFDQGNTQVSAIAPQRKILLLFVLLLAVSEFVIRGPVRLIERAGDYNDYTSSYVGAKAWIQGLNPYSNDVFWQLWEQAGHRDSDEKESIGSRTPYPWTCLLILAPFSLLSPKAASMAVGLVFSAGILIAIFLLSSLLGVQKESWRRWLFIAICLALSPIHSGLGQVNISMGAIALALLGWWALETNRPGLAGAFFAFSVGLKPPIGAFFVLFCLLKRQWRAFGITVATGCALAAVAIGRLQLAGMPWLSAYLANSKLVLTDPINSITAANPKRFQMINLQVLWYSLTRNERSANLLAFLVAGLLLATLAYLLLKNRGMSLAPLEMSALAVVSLLPVYHRFYDASLLTLPLLWVLSDRSDQTKSQRTMLWVLLTPFAMPGAWALESLQNANRIPSSITGHWWWNALFLGHEIWALLLIAIVLTSVLMRVAQNHEKSSSGNAPVPAAQPAG